MLVSVTDPYSETMNSNASEQCQQSRSKPWSVGIINQLLRVFSGWNATVRLGTLPPHLVSVLNETFVIASMMGPEGGPHLLITNSYTIFPGKTTLWAVDLR